jgi:hypothetical protein
MAMIEAVGIRKLVVLVAALAVALSMMGCAASGAGPLSSHGVDYAPSFNPEEGVGGVDAPNQSHSKIRARVAVSPTAISMPRISIQ